MSQSSGPPPPDEPIIGGPPPGVPSPPSPPIGYGQESAPYAPPATYADDEYADDYDEWEEDEYGEDEYGYDYEEPPPTRQPIFYVFLGLAAIVGAVVVFFLFMLLRGNGSSASPTVTPQFSVLIDSPQSNTRVDTGTQQAFAVRAKSTAPLETIALMVDGAVADSTNVSNQPKPSDGVYHATLKTTFDQKKTYQVAVRVTTITGVTHDSSPITIIAVEPLSGSPTTPATVTGTVVATVSVRSGPGDNYGVINTLQAGDPVTIIGKSGDGQWLVLQGAGQGNNQDGWVRAAAIQASGPLDGVPVRQAPTAPTATATNTPPPTNTPTQTPKQPDFVPGNATLASGAAVLDITVANIGLGAYEGPLVIAVSGVTGALNHVFNVSIPANGGTVLSFPLAAPLENGGNVTVTVNPNGDVPEARQDNNTATFTLQPPQQPTPTPGLPTPTPNGGSPTPTPSTQASSPTAAPTQQ